MTELHEMTLSQLGRALKKELTKREQLTLDEAAGIIALILLKYMAEVEHDDDAKRLLRS
jgi:hypothetical protein